jgi:bifunctional DNA-binding transcriptional regulator/antitoxin component of YhaV-PrlF toxin-antitoxin module
MVKITKVNNQYRVNIPKEIMQQTGWDENTELIFMPYIKHPNDIVNSETTILMKKILGGKK